MKIIVTHTLLVYLMSSVKGKNKLNRQHSSRRKRATSSLTSAHLYAPHFFVHLVSAEVEFPTWVFEKGNLQKK